MIEALFEEYFNLKNLSSKELDKLKSQQTVLKSKVIAKQAEIGIDENVNNISYADLNKELKILQDKLKVSCDKLQEIKLNEHENVISKINPSKNGSPNNSLCHEDPFMWDNELSFTNACSNLTDKKSLLCSPSSTVDSFLNSYVSLRDVSKVIHVSNDFNYDGDEFLVETDKNKMIEKICELQKKVAILNEEVDHLENHIDYLNFNLKKKTK